MLSTISCMNLKGVGAKVAEALARLNIYTVQDLLFHLPSRYQNRFECKQVNTLQISDVIKVVGILKGAQVITGRRRSLICELEDGTGRLTLRFFHFSKHQLDFFLKKVGKHLSCFGEIRRGFNGFEMFHPEIQWIGSDGLIQELEDTSLTPIYPASKGLNQMLLRKLTDQALDLLKKIGIQECLPEEILREHQLMNLGTALEIVHRPPLDAKLHELETRKHPSQLRLAFEELMAHQVALRKFRNKVMRTTAVSLKNTDSFISSFLARLPFELTQGQRKAYQEISHDLERNVPMLRLLQGDVGSGKTVVAALAILKAVAHGHQAALMAPTELLAEQHFQCLNAWFKPLGIVVGHLSGNLKIFEKKKILQDLLSGKINVVTGTHALFQEEVRFNSLVLIVIDEQHRFGVQQRLALKDKGMHGDYFPHQLIMTATPIPRTLAMTAYTDLDHSVIDELPKSRKPITTVLISNNRRFEVLERVQKNCQLGKQVYWVCTLINESEVLECEAAEKLFETLSKKLSGIKIGLVHGRCKPDAKDKIMHDFKKGEIDLLIATTVIEVGIDVPNASLMVIENAERLGLAQLHQLRGRVGRSTEQSYCVLLYQSPLNQISKKRLMTLRETTNGFLIAEKDLELRGPGEILGSRQAGFMRFKIADLMRDEMLLPAVRGAVDVLLRDHVMSMDALVKRWLSDGEKLINV